MAIYNWVNISSGDGLLPDGIKPLPEPVLTSHQRSRMAFTWGQQRDIFLDIRLLKMNKIDTPSWTQDLLIIPIIVYHLNWQKNVYIRNDLLFTYPHKMSALLEQIHYCNIKWKCYNKSIQWYSYIAQILNSFWFDQFTQSKLKLIYVYVYTHKCVCTQYNFGAITFIRTVTKNKLW